MVCEHLLGCFILKDPSSGFLELFQVIVVVCGDIPKLVAIVLGSNKLLVMAKDTSGLCFIVVSKVFLWFIICSIVL
jgi:hypothetical protein